MRYRSSDHLVALVEDAGIAAARIADADPARRAAAARAARRTAARLSARLDGSPLDDATADAVDARDDAGEPATALSEEAPALEEAPPGSGAAGWARVLRLDAMDTQDVAAVEYANLLASTDAEAGLAPAFAERPLEALAALHGSVCRGLVAPEVAGRPRRSEQAVHDGAQGRVLYHAPPADAVPGLLAALGAWLGGAAEVPAVLVAGVVHERLLQWQPFEAGNGRVARAAARLVLRARGVDTDGLAVPEAAFATDPIGYYGEVAATIRRRDDLTPWLERHTEAVVAALQAAADEVAPAPPADLPDPAARLGAALAPGETVTVAAYADEAGLSRPVARDHLRALSRAGILAVDPGTRGLRYRRR